MQYTVIWSPDALKQLTEVWLNATDRNAVTTAVDQIDRLLSSSPTNQGESRFEDRRVLIPSLRWSLRSTFTNMQSASSLSVCVHRSGQVERLGLSSALQGKYRRFRWDPVA